jgi:hypothetical protein
VIKRLFGLLLCGLLTCTSSIAEEVLSGETKTYCFARFLVDVPREVVLTGRRGKYYAKEFETGRGAEEFKIIIASMLEKRKKKHSNMGQHLLELNILKGIQNRSF